MSIKTKCQKWQLSLLRVNCRIVKEDNLTPIFLALCFLIASVRALPTWDPFPLQYIGCLPIACSKLNFLVDCFHCQGNHPSFLPPKTPPSAFICSIIYLIWQSEAPWSANGPVEGRYKHFGLFPLHQNQFYLNS